jgi:glycine/D-amino acid oxidase-like deaminating enzyme
VTDGDPEAPEPAVPRTADAVVVGAGIIGACCALELAERGLSVVVLERGAVAAATTAAGEGNLLLSDKLPGPELELARLSLDLWHQLPGRLDVPADDLELEPKGGLLVARTEAAATALRALAADHRSAGVAAHDLDPAGAAGLEPALTPDLVGAVHYPQDAQVNPVLATTTILAAARRHGATVLPNTEVTAITRATAGSPAAASPAGDGAGAASPAGDGAGAASPAGDSAGGASPTAASSGGDATGGGGALSVRTSLGTVSAPVVVVAAGPWSGRVARAAGAVLPVEPRRGLVLVTEPLPVVVRHKVYDAGYLAAVGADDAGLHAAAVVEATRAGTVLIGSTRQRVGFDRTVPVAALRLLAAGAVGLFPALRSARAIRAYGGFRPYSPDHLPIIGPDPDLPGLWYATGHEGAGIGLAPGTARLLADRITGAAPAVDPAPFRPDRPALRAAAIPPAAREGPGGPAVSQVGPEG